MEKEIKTEIEIRANAASIWKVLSDFKNYEKWNPFIVSIQGEQKNGSRIRVKIKQPGGNTMKMKPEILAFNPPSEFRWKGQLFFAGLFDGEHIFEIFENPDGSCRFVQREKFSGILIPLFRKMLDTRTIEGFKLMNKALKTQAEQLWKTTHFTQPFSSE